MAKKRKSVATRLDEVDRTLYSSFCSAANSVSQLYSQAMNHQRVSFQSGERHALDKLYQWILRKQEDGSRVTTADIVSYLQNELELGADEAPISPRLSFPHQQNQQSLSHFTNSGAAIPTTNPFLAGGFGGQGKNTVFSNALSSPIRRSLQHYHLTQSSSSPSNNGHVTPPPRTNDSNYSQQQQQHQSRELNPTSSNDTAMDMHAESPDQDSIY